MGPKILTGALVRDTGTLRVSNIFPRTFWEVKMRKINFKIFGDFFRARLIFSTTTRVSDLGRFSVQNALFYSHRKEGEEQKTTHFRGWLLGCCELDAHVLRTFSTREARLLTP